MKKKYDKVINWVKIRSVRRAHGKVRLMFFVYIFFPKYIMCGIWCLLGNYDPTDVLSYYENLSPRGPDNKKVWYYGDLILGFHRLAIMDLSSKGDQPFWHTKRNISLICNGEIFNYEDLITKFQLTLQSKSDCEVILYLYEKIGIDGMIRQLDGEFAFVIYDQDTNEIIVARDPFGVRPVFMGIDELNGNILFSSEIKGIPEDYKIEHVKPGYYYKVDMNKFKMCNSLSELVVKKQYYTYTYYTFPIAYNRKIEQNINELLKNAVYKRLMSDRPIGCLLSGGLDSSLIAGIAAQKIGNLLHTFSIGMENSPDIKYAQEVAKYIGSTHHEIIMNQKNFLEAIDTVIYTIESFDVTTVRASVGHYLIAGYIRKNTDVKVILGGEGADELCGGYIYFQKAPSPEDFNYECIRLLKNIHIFDVLRSDRSISSAWGLESRVPFLDKDFVKFYMSINPKLKCDGNKDLLRNSFVSDYIIPDNILRRRKEAFSDGITPKENSWHNIIETYMECKVTNDELPQDTTKEQYYYKKKFIEFYGTKNTSIIPYYWKPNEKWVGTQTDPSARTLDLY